MPARNTSSAELIKTVRKGNMMARPTMDPEQILGIREKILDRAADIINEEGYHNLSMRKIGARLGMTAANLYNYYANKDEINIAIRLRAGKILYQRLKKAYEAGPDMTQKLQRMMIAYITFGLEMPSYYSIMFDMPTPKYADYEGSALETLARQEKESSEKSVGLMRQFIEQLKPYNPNLPQDTDLAMALIWSQLHGLVSLYSNNSFSEILSHPDQILFQAVEEAFGHIFPNPQSKRLID